MTENEKQSQELANKIWAIADDLRGSMDSSKFKDYILGILFYRYLSEKTEYYMNDLLKEDGLTYTEALDNKDFAPVVREWSIEYLGYIIEPKYLWPSLIDEIKNKEFTIDHLEKAISELVASTIGQESEAAFDRLFDDMNLQDKDLGKEVSDRTSLISKVMTQIADIPFGVDDAEMDILGTAYMILISLFASDAGKKGGEFFTPTCASKLLAELATVGLDEVKNVADSCAGSGSLLLQVQNYLSTKRVGHFYATEKIGSNYNLLRMNFLMHGIPYKMFTCFNADSIKTDNYYENGEPILFDVQVENPPYSAKYEKSKQLLDDPRFASCGVLCPQGRADLMFVESMVYHMADDGRIACLLPNAALFRGKKSEAKGKDNAEYVIRKHLIENLNVIDAVIGLPAKMFHGAKLPVIVMVLKKNRSGQADNILFIDASQYYTVDGKTNIITDEDINRIVNAYKERQNIDKYAHVASLDEIRENDYDCNIPKYIDSLKTEEVPIDINEQINIIQRCDQKSNEIGNQLSSFFVGLQPEDIMNNTVKLKFKDNSGNIYPEWQDTMLNDVLTERHETSSGDEEVYSVSVYKGLVNQIEHLGRSYAADDTSNYSVVRPGDIVYTKSPTGDFKWGIVKQSKIDKPVIVSPLYGVFIPKSEALGYLIEAYFSSKERAHDYLITQVKKGAKNTINVTNDEFLAKAISLPVSEEEVEQIKRVIELFDQLTDLENDKLTAMQNIKKELLRRIFI